MLDGNLILIFFYYRPEASEKPQPLLKDLLEKPEKPRTILERLLEKPEKPQSPLKDLLEIRRDQVPTPTIKLRSMLAHFFPTRDPHLWKILLSFMPLYYVETRIISGGFVL